MSTKPAFVIVCPVGYAIGAEIDNDGALTALTRAEIFEMGYLWALAASAAAPEWAMAQLRRTFDWEGFIEDAREAIAEHPVGE